MPTVYLVWCLTILYTNLIFSLHLPYETGTNYPYFLKMMKLRFRGVKEVSKDHKTSITCSQKVRQRQDHVTSEPVPLTIVLNIRFSNKQLWYSVFMQCISVMTKLNPFVFSCDQNSKDHLNTLNPCFWT